MRVHCTQDFYSNLQCSFRFLFGLCIKFDIVGDRIQIGEHCFERQLFVIVGLLRLMIVTLILDDDLTRRMQCDETRFTFLISIARTQPIRPFGIAVVAKVRETVQNQFGTLDSFVKARPGNVRLRL